MKTSDKILTSAITVFFVVLAGMMFFVRANIHTRPIKERPFYASGDTTAIYSLKDFRFIQVAGPWRIDAVRSTQCNVIVCADKKILPHCKVTVRHDTLMVIDDTPEAISDKSLTLSVGCPSLIGVSLSGAIALSMKDFLEESLTIVVAGTSRVVGAGMTVKSLAFTSTGALNLDFSDVAATAATISLAGTTDAFVNVSGGELNGSIVGTGSVNYIGAPSAVKVSTFGIAYIYKG